MIFLIRQMNKFDLNCHIRSNYSFNLSEFANEVIGQPDIIKKFNQYKSTYAQDFDVDFTNEERFVFFFRLTNHLQSDYFKCENIKDIAMKPENASLPEEIKWMEDINKIVLSGNSLDKKYFIEDKKYHKNLILWSIDASYTFNFNGHIGKYTINFGFPDFATSKKEIAEFELNISSLSPDKAIDTRSRTILKSELLSKMDKQKSIVYNNFLEYKNKENE